jgi:capsular polysaccharide transport system permease protein
MKIKVWFIALFVVGVLYIVLFETERYESSSIVHIRDLSQKQDTSAFDLILSQGSPVMQDSKLLELYIRSEDMMLHLDKMYTFHRYYTSDAIDFVRKLSTNAWFPFYQLTKENLLEAYNRDLTIVYDEESTSLQVSFAHAEPNVSKAIVSSIIEHSKNRLNTLERENANVALSFLKEQVEESKKVFIESIKRMMRYQNRHHTINPNLDVETKYTILANLETDLTKRTVEYESKVRYMVKDSEELKIAQNTINNLKKEIQEVKKEIAGSNDSKELNKVVFDYQLLSNEIDFNKEVYKQSLAKLEELRSQVNQNIKNILVITQPTLAEQYTYPEKLKDIMTLLIVLGFLYGIIASVLALLKEHQD